VQFKVIMPSSDQRDRASRESASAALFAFTLGPDVVRIDGWVDDLAPAGVCLQESFTLVGNGTPREIAVRVPVLPPNMLSGHAVDLHAEVHYDGRTERHTQRLYPA
jgi:hypothetical protein